MPYTDLLLVYDLLGLVIARGCIDTSHRFTSSNYSHKDMLSCLCMLWRERLIPAPVVHFDDGKSTINFDGGASASGVAMHGLLRETLFSSPNLKQSVGRA